MSMSYWSSYVCSSDLATIAAILKAVPLDLLQLHGSESPERVAAVMARFGLPGMKVVKLRGAGDREAARPYLGVADRLLFDAKPPAAMKDALQIGRASCRERVCQYV